MNEFGVEPHQCLVVEDSEHGIQAAVASGAHLHKVTDAQDLDYFKIFSQIQSIN